MKAKIEDVIAQVKEKLDLEATYMPDNRAIIVGDSLDGGLVLWFAEPVAGVFDTDELEESCSVNGDGRLHVHDLETFDVETLEEFLEKVKNITQK